MTCMEPIEFRFEKLIVWQASVEFADELLTLSESIRDQKLSYRLAEQLAAASTSVSMNIAEGRGRSSTKSYILHLQYSKGSPYEVVTLCTILHNRKWIDKEANEHIREMASSIAKMLNALITSLKKKMTESE